MKQEIMERARDYAAKIEAAGKLNSINKDIRAVIGD